MFLILLAALLLRNFNILNNNQQPCQPSPSQRSEGGQGVVVDNGHSSFAADTIHSEGAVTAGLWFVLTWSIYHIKVKMKTVYGEDLQETSRCQSADQTCNWCLTRPRLFILSHIIHSLGSHNYNIIRQFKSQFINYTLHNAQRMALLQHLSLSDRACLVYSSKGNGCSRIWVFYWRVETSSEPGPCLSADYLSLSAGSCGVLVISAGPAHPAPAVSPRPAHVTVSRPGNWNIFYVGNIFSRFLVISVIYLSVFRSSNY